MRAFWHPVSALYLDEPRALASPAILRLMLAGEGRAAVVYAGDRMWPSVRHGQELRVAPLAQPAASAGDVVVVVADGILDVLRLTTSGPALRVAADADGSFERDVLVPELIGVVPSLAGRSWWPRAIARMWLDVAEALTLSGGGPADAAETVRDKYDDQAVHYDRRSSTLEQGLGTRIVERASPGASVLVAGSGAGKECFALERLGYRVTGVDFSARMVEAAAAEAEKIGSTVRFVCADLRTHEAPAGSFAAVVFTYDVYSFVPYRADRETLLANVSSWLAPGGAVFLSGRRVAGAWDRIVLTLQWLSARSRGRTTEWGDSHTRWLDGAGRMRRSFIHVFTDRRLDREAQAAGLTRRHWEGGHGVFVART